MTSVSDRVAGAPITRGVREVPGWGHRMRPDRVLREMRSTVLEAAPGAGGGQAGEAHESLSYLEELVGESAPT